MEGNKSTEHYPYLTNSRYDSEQVNKSPAAGSILISDHLQLQKDLRVAQEQLLTYRDMIKVLRIEKELLLTLVKARN